MALCGKKLVWAARGGPQGHPGGTTSLLWQHVWLGVALAPRALRAEGCVRLSGHPGHQPGILLPGDTQSTRHQTAERC